MTTANPTCTTARAYAIRSIEKLNQKAEVQFDHEEALDKWLKCAAMIHNQASVLLQEGTEETMKSYYVLMLRYVIMVFENIPNHPGYTDKAMKVEHKKLLANTPAAVKHLEIVKDKLGKLFEAEFHAKCAAAVPLGCSASSPAVPLPAPHPQPGPPTSPPAQRKRNRWADGLEAPAAGERPFFPGGWTPSKNVWEAVEVFGQTKEDVRALAANARPKVAKLKLVQISVSDKLVAAVLAYTKEAPNLYADLNKACRSPGGRWEQLLTHYRDYLYHLNRAIQALPNFSGDVYRGIDDCSLGDAYVEGKTITWQQFSSASKKPNVALRFLRADGSRLVGSLFILQVDTGKELEMCSEFPDEEEVLLPLNSHFKVRRVIKDEASKLETLPMLKHYQLSGLLLYVLEQL